MDPSCSHTLQSEGEARVLGALLDTFHPVFSLQEIASAYCRAGSDPCKASEILCQLQKSNSNIVHPENDNGTHSVHSEESFCEDNAKDPNEFFNVRESKAKKLSTTVGTVSAILGKGYARPTSSKKEMVEAIKPLKLEVIGSSVDKLDTGSVKLEEHLDHKDTEEFLFSMLGDGFNLSRDMIREVLAIDGEDTYGMLRRDAKEHWDKMKELYEAAIEAYANGDRSKANDLLEEGRCHTRMAREADEKSAVEIFETKKSDTQNDVPLNLHTHSSRDSIRLLKKHLLSLANIRMFRYLKVIVNTDAEDTTKGKRKKMVIKLLERESIKWTEEDGKPGTILIQLNEIDRSKLTFANDLQ